MKKRVPVFLMSVLLAVVCCAAAFADSVPLLPRTETPSYRVSFYAFDCFNMMDEDGIRTGYGYDMMQGLAKYLQCTFSYEGYDKTAAECEEMLRNGEIDLYTAAKKTPERQAEFAFTTHPAITAKNLHECENLQHHCSGRRLQHLQRSAHWSVKAPHLQ